MTSATPLIYTQKPEAFEIQMEVAACYLDVGGKLLFLRRSKDRNGGGSWCVPGGKLEKGESALDAGVRELFEETGIAVLPSQAQAMGMLYVYRNDLKDLAFGKEGATLPKTDASSRFGINQTGLGFTFHMFRFSLSCEPEVRLNAEHDAYQWLSAHEIESVPLMAGGRTFYRYYTERSVCI